jgi:hypothetical protein
MNENSRSNRVFFTTLKSLSIRRGMAWGTIIIGALVAFEMFNYSTTQFALNDVLGDLKFVGIRWATILALAFCGIDFAGLARLFTPEQGHQERVETWYLFGAWLLAAAMNATLTWWGVAVAIANHSNLSSEVINSSTLIKVVPVFVAIMVCLIRVLIIGTFSVKGGKLFSQAESHGSSQHTPNIQPVSMMNSHPHPVSVAQYQPASKAARPVSNFARTEPTYHNLPMQSRAAQEPRYVDTPHSS